MKIRILMVDDDEQIGNNASKLFNGSRIKENEIDFVYIKDFGDAMPKLSQSDFDIIILDLYKGDPRDTNEDRPGEKVLEEIKKQCFIPVIFFTGLTNRVDYLKSDIIRVVSKADNFDNLKIEIEKTIDSRLIFIRNKLDSYIRNSMKEYFWDFVHKDWNLISEIKDEVSLSYLLIRRLGNSLSRRQIIKLLEDDPKISSDKIHPMEFYVYPSVSKDFETGDLLRLSGETFVILTPTCDFVCRKGQMDAKNALIARCSLLRDHEKLKKYKENQSSTEANNGLISLLRGGDKRFFFIPGTFFIEDSLIDFQDVKAVPCEELSSYNKIATLDDPFAQSMLAHFVRYYNRVGHQDLDFENLIGKYSTPQPSPSPSSSEQVRN